ncbi:helix-turn-helix transcriptional regulator [Microbacterium sp. APC 3898]|uniref:Helix-turn-helix transcriptional regulator n=1 Tax=Planococcus notacanthi TaxID=3035188 RepID=A0ABT7ZF20_9BACL|nr:MULTISPECIES: helix-turn-helix transcriptional regulator [Terrabacteria group]MDN3425744.1 helix-turn-helix transcriptional regulator [Planococcus sp. APC 4016]MDN3500708.1 helix-turn-helix transcriptional regulator [Microbacterium sp. APC 3898]
MKQIGEKLKKLREDNQLSVDELALALGFAKTVIWGYESGKKQVSVSHLEMLADYYKVTVDFLLEREQISDTLDLLNLTDLNSIKLVVDDQPVNQEELAEVTSYLQVKRRLKEEADQLQGRFADLKEG